MIILVKTTTQYTVGPYFESLTVSEITHKGKNATYF